MSTLPSVISRFVDYYATLDTQPPSALAGIYRADATLIDPFGEFIVVSWMFPGWLVLMLTLSVFTCTVQAADWLLHFDDWMYLQDSTRLFNKTEMKKLGVTVATVTLFFTRKTSA